MYLKSILNFFHAPGKTQCPHNVCSAEEFKKLLQRERARADRSGLQFSVITFQFRDNSNHASHLQHVVNLVSRRIRMTDIAGWLQKDTIAILLFNASGKDAWQLAKEIIYSIHDKVPLPACKVYTYPHYYLSDSQEECESRSSSDIENQTDSHKLNLLDGRTQVPNDDKELLPIEALLGPKTLIWKRMLDIIGALLGLIILSPFFAFVSVLIKIISPGPVFFKQERIGYLGKPFVFWKFRTMKPNADTSEHKAYMRSLIKNNQPMSKLDHDPQIIPLGSFIRKSCIDELPQLINVLRGEMSLVGPRPCIPYEYKEYLLWHKRRFSTLPGMTGLWQVNGKNRVSFIEMIRMDIVYEQQRSLWLDIRILIKTLPAILKQASAPLGQKLNLNTEINCSSLRENGLYQPPSK